MYLSDMVELCYSVYGRSVTHFDDLNTYAFLDLIVGLLESNAGRQQFVLSTCDEKLLELARQKFRHLDKAAKFYRFSALGQTALSLKKLVWHKPREVSLRF